MQSGLQERGSKKCKGRKKLLSSWEGGGLYTLSESGRYLRSARRNACKMSARKKKEGPREELRG